MSNLRTLEITQGNQITKKGSWQHLHLKHSPYWTDNGHANSNKNTTASINSCHSDLLKGMPTRHSKNTAGKSWATHNLYFTELSLLQEQKVDHSLTIQQKESQYFSQV